MMSGTSGQPCGKPFASYDPDRLFIAVTAPGEAPPHPGRQEQPRWPGLREDAAPTLWGPRPGNSPGNNRFRWNGEQEAIERWQSILGREAPEPLITGPRGAPKLNARFTEWMMGLPDGWVTDVQGVTREQAIEVCGNGVVPHQAVQAMRELLAA